MIHLKLKVIFGSLLVVKSIQCNTCAKTSEPIVQVNQGKLRGTEEELLDGRPYYSFKGVPYAKPPVENLRFSAPLPPDPWSGVYDATQHGSVCTQFDSSIKQYTGNEDCLFVNVYTTSLQSNARMPVMVFIHGGSNLEGDGNADNGIGFGPEFLLKHRVLLVTMNYRLEVLGFLNLDTKEVPGNAGAKDQTMALRWVRENIEQFGGDPNKVTLFGESSGASNVVLHMQSPMSKGLFHRVIAQSGVSFEDWALAKNSKERAFRLAKLLGCNATDSDEILKFFRSLPAKSLTNVTVATMTEEERRRDLPEQFVPSVEKRFDNVQPFITEAPIDALVNKKLVKVPVMVGYNSNEALIMVDEQALKLNLYNENPEYLVPREAAEKLSRRKQKEFGNQIKKFYVGNGDFVKNQIFIDMLSDRHFGYNIHRFSHEHSKSSLTYLYIFNYDTELNMFKKLLEKTNYDGACHSDEVFYMFYGAINKEAYEKNSGSEELVYAVTKIWTDFAKTGNPTPHQSSDVGWPAYSEQKRRLLVLQNKTMVAHAHNTRIQFWDKLYCDAGSISIMDC